jgi:hypothetical protein
VGLSLGLDVVEQPAQAAHDAVVDRLGRHLLDDSVDLRELRRQGLQEGELRELPGREFDGHDR